MPSKEDLTLNVQIKTRADEAKKVRDTIQSEGGFSGKKGSVALNKVNNLISMLESSKGVDDFIKNLKEVQKELVNSAKYVKNLSKDMVAALEKMTAAQQKYDEKVENLKIVRENRKSAYQKVAANENVGKYTYKSAKTGREVTSVDTITGLHKSGDLEIYNLQNKKISGQVAENVYSKNFGEVDRTNEEVLRAEQEIEDAKIEVAKAEIDLSTVDKTSTEIPQSLQAVKGFSEENDLLYNEDVKKSNLDIDTNIKSLDKQSSSLGKAFKQFSLYAIALRTAKRALRDAVKTVKDLDKYLTEQAMVTGRTRKETYGLLKSYQDLAAGTGATTKEVAEVATQFMRQGKTAKDALTLTEAAVKAAKVAGISATESVNYLTTALNGFRLTAQDAMSVSDKFASVAAQSATSYEEIAIALSKVAAQANLAGMSIDYTTALLAKGIETTREAPETIGTALKTVIARMRELTDYGETLEGDTDINNVETQLKYIGIELRNDNGELRSTEDVLDNLGKKWDTLNSNQQAAVAKALAGTRQQSRLIAMMSDYERTIELQEIATRSAGATSAQAATYMEGMEAALNKINVAWEQIVTNLTNSDAIIGIVNSIGTMLEKVGDFFSTSSALVPVLTLILMSVTKTLTTKMQEMMIAKQQAKIEKEKQITELKSSIEKRKQLIIEKAKTLEAEKQEKISEIQQALEAKKITSAQAAQQMAAINAEIGLEQEKLLVEEEQLALLEKDRVSSSIDIAANTALAAGGILSGATNSMTWLGVLTAIALVLKTIPPIIKIANAEIAKGNATTLVGALFSMAKNAASTIGLPGLIIAGTLLAMAGIAGVANLVNNAKTDTDKTVDSVNSLSSEIYKLTEKANAIKKVTDAYDELDKKVIQTAKDEEEMSNLLGQAADKLDTTNAEDWNKQDYKNAKKRQKNGKASAEDLAKIQSYEKFGGKSEQDYYNNLSEEDKKDYLDRREKELRDEANQKRKQQLDMLRGLDSEQRKKILTSKDNSSYLETQSAISAINNNILYDYIDTLDNVKEGTEKFTQSILESLDPLDAYKYATEEDGKSIEKLTDLINNSTKIIGNDTISLSEVLTSDDYSFKDKIEAYNDLYKSIESLGDPTLTKALKDAYGQWDTLNKKFSESIDFIDKLGISIQDINDIASAIQKLGYTADQSSEKLSEMFKEIENGASLESTIAYVFEDTLGKFDRSTEEGAKAWTAAYNTILNAYQSAVGQGALNMGQNLTKLTNQVNSFYEKASNWSSMTEQEKTEFMSDNYKMFEGDGGKALYRAFETGDYNEIQKALANNDALKETIKLRLQELQTDLAIEEARRATGEANEAYIEELKKNIKELEDYENQSSKIYQASLDLRLEQEQKQLDIYKDYLSKQQEALTDSLNKRKDAYQKYFDAINQEKEDEEYEEEANRLISNISKLSSSDNAASKRTAKELENQLKDLEEERLKTLRERAQEGIISNIDNEVEEINDKFDKLLENNQNLLAAMLTDENNKDSFMANIVSSGIAGMTANEAEKWFRDDFMTTFGSAFNKDAIEEVEEAVTQYITNLNVNGTNATLTTDQQQNLYKVIMEALTAIGYN